MNIFDALAQIGDAVAWLVSSPVAVEGRRYPNLDEGEIPRKGTTVRDVLCHHGALGTVDHLEATTFFRTSFPDIFWDNSSTSPPKFKVRVHVLFRRNGRRDFVKAGMLGSDLGSLLFRFTDHVFTSQEMADFKFGDQ